MTATTKTTTKTTTKGYEMTNTPNTRAALMGRVSTEAQATEDKDSLRGQIERGRAYADRQGWEVVAELTETLSGATPIFQRPAVAELLTLAEAGEVEVAVWDNSDRLARDQIESLTLAQKLADLGVEVHLVSTGKVDRSTPEGVMLSGVMGALAEAERLRIKQRMARGRYGSAKAGRWVVGIPPLGTRVGSDGRLEVDPEGAEVVRFFVESTLAGNTATETAKLANERFDYRPRRGGKAFSSGHVGNVMAAPYAYGGGVEVNIRPNGLAAEEPELIVLPSPKLVEQDDLLTARDLLTRKATAWRKAKNIETTVSHDYGLRGRLFHEEPDGRLLLMTGLKRSEKGVRLMRCSAATTRYAQRHPHEDGCSGFGFARNRARLSAVRAAVVEAIAAEWLAGTFANRETLVEVIRESDRRALAIEATADTVTQVEGVLADLEAERGRVRVAFTKGWATEAETDAELVRIDAELAETRDRLARLQASRSEAQHYIESVETLLTGTVTLLGIEPGDETELDEDPDLGTFVSVPGWAEALSYVKGAAGRVLAGVDAELDPVVIEWLGEMAERFDLKAIVRDIGEDVPTVEVEARLPGSKSQPRRVGGEGHASPDFRRAMVRHDLTFTSPAMRVTVAA